MSMRTTKARDVWLAWVFTTFVVPIKLYGEPTMTVHNLNWVRCTNQALWRTHNDRPYSSMLPSLAIRFPLHCLHRGMDWIGDMGTGFISWKNYQWIGCVTSMTLWAYCSSPTPRILTIVPTHFEFAIPIKLRKFPWQSLLKHTSQWTTTHLPYSLDCTGF